MTELATSVDLFNRAQDQAEVRAFLKDAQRRYFHWDELRRRPPPAGWTAGNLWAIIHFMRQPKRQLPLTDVTGRPFQLFQLPSLAGLLHEVDRKAGTPMLPVDPDLPTDQLRTRILLDRMVEEAISTSRIEGANTTRRVAKELLRTKRPPRDRSEQMIFNSYRTIQYLHEHRRQRLSLELIHDIQRLITQDTLDEPDDAGRFRQSDDVHIVDERDNDVVFTPPPADTIEPRMEALVAFANQPADEHDFIHPLIKAAVLHFTLAYIHPYVDGNGRTARSLFYWYMLHHGYELFQFLSISAVTERRWKDYYNSFLFSEDGGRDLTYSVVYMAQATGTAIDEFYARVSELVAEQQRMSGLAATTGLNYRQREVVDHALQHPNQAYTFEAHARSHGVVYQTARTDLLDLVTRQLLVDTQTRRPRAFVPAPDLAQKLGLIK